MGKTVQAPPTPDFTGAAQAQTGANLDAAIASGYLSNPQITTPTTKQTVSYALDQTSGKYYIPTVTQTFNTGNLTGQALDDAQYQQALQAKALGVLGNSAITKAGTVLDKSIPGQGTALKTSIDAGVLGPNGDNLVFGGFDPLLNNSKYNRSFDIQKANLEGLKGVTASAGDPAQAFGYSPQGGIQSGVTGAGQGSAQGYSGRPTLQGSVGAGLIDQGPSGQGQQAIGGGVPLSLQGLDMSGVQGVQGGPNLFSFGQADQSRISGPQFQGVGDYGPVSSGPSASQYQGGPGAGQYGYSQAGPSAGLYGNFGGGPSAGAYGYSQNGPQQGQFGTFAGGVEGPNIQGLDQSGIGAVQSGVQAGQYGLAQGAGQTGPTLRQQYDESGVAQAPINAGTTAQQAIMSRLDPQLQRSRASLENQLINQGLRPGDEAYNNAMQILGQQENDQRTQAVLQGLNLDMSANQQGFGQAAQRGAFGNQAALEQFNAGLAGQQAGNQAINQNFGQALMAQEAGNAAQEQQFRQRVQAGEFGNQAQLASFGANLQNQAAQNQAIASNFGQGQAAAEMQNQAAQQNFAQGQSATAMLNQAIQQAFGQGQAATQMGNQAAQQNFAQAQAAAQMANQAQSQGFSDAQSAANQFNAAQQQRFNEGITSTNIYNQNQGNAFDAAMRTQQAWNTALGQNQSALAQQQQLFNAAQQQQYQQALARGEFGNQTALQVFGAGLQNQQAGNQAIQQNLNSALALQQARNQAQSQQFGQGLQQAQLFNQAAGQGFDMGLQGQQQSNQAVAQNFSQALQAQQAANQAQQQGFQQGFDARAQGNQAAAQNFQQALAGAGFRNDAQQQDYQQRMSTNQQQNDATQQNYANILSYINSQNQGVNQAFNQRLSAAQFGNAAQQQDLAQQIQLRQLPLNEITALMSGTQVQNPQFQAYQGQTTAPGNYQSAAQQQAQWNMTRYQQDVANRNAMMSGLFSLAGAAVGACWIAEVLFGKFTAKTMKLRAWVNGDMRRTRRGEVLYRFYRKHGRDIAEEARQNPNLRAALIPIFERGLEMAEANHV